MHFDFKLKFYTDPSSVFFFSGYVGVLQANLCLELCLGELQTSRISNKCEKTQSDPFFSLPFVLFGC